MINKKVLYENINLLIVDDKAPEAFIKELKENNINFEIIKH